MFVPFNRLHITAGRAPGVDGEAALDKNTAEAEGMKIGDAISVLDPRQAPHRFRLVGLFDVGVDQDLVNGAVDFTAADAAAMTGKHTYVELDVVTAGPAPDRLSAAVTAVVGSGFHVQTGRQRAADLSERSGTDMQLLGFGLLLFGMIALLVAGLVIYNTFTILIAQRTQEMALLRCIGATRRQIFGSILLESLVVGVLSSILGLLTGLGLAAAAVLFIENGGADLPVGTLTLPPGVIAVGLSTGTLVTVVAALFPARAATRVAPIAALRSQSENHTFRAGVARVVFASLFGLAGTGLTVLGALTGSGQSAMVLVLAGGVLVFFAVLILGPVIVRPLSALAGWLPRRVFGVAGRLAVVNSRRNPKRAATTTVALTVGVTLMTAMSVLIASVRATATEEFDTKFPADYLVSAQSGTVPPSVAKALRTRPEIDSVTEFRSGIGTVDGVPRQVGTLTQASLGTAIKPSTVSGSMDGFGRGDVALALWTAEDLGVRVGSTVTVDGTQGRAAELKVVALTESDLLPPIMISEQDFQWHFGDVGAKNIFVNAVDSVPAPVSRKVLNEVTRAYPTIAFKSTREVRSQLEDSIDELLNIVIALLGLAVVISLLGIANTLSLSVHERTRESALLRALGLTRGQLRGMLFIEALVLGLVGALIGIVIGVVYGWTGANTIKTGMVLRLPVGQILLFIALSGIAGVLASLLPARRAARGSIVGALGST